jgi:hypothetical protein
MPKEKKTKTSTQGRPSTQAHAAMAADHGAFSIPGVTSLGEEGGPTIIGDGPVAARIPDDDEWYNKSNN